MNQLSVIVLLHNMSREASNTLYSLSTQYQRDVLESEYQVIAIDNGTERSFDVEKLDDIGANVFLHNETQLAASPFWAINRTVEWLKSEYIAIAFNGGCLHSPGMIRSGLDALLSTANPFVYSLGWKLGPGQKQGSASISYDEREEQKLLSQISWKADGYGLFEASSPSRRTATDWYGPCTKSEMFFLRREDFIRLGGYDTAFSSEGGGFGNSDFFTRALQDNHLKAIRLLGEGTFQQYRQDTNEAESLKEDRARQREWELNHLRGYYRPKSFACGATYGETPANRTQSPEGKVEHAPSELASSIDPTHCFAEPSVNNQWCIVLGPTCAGKSTYLSRVRASMKAEAVPPVLFGTSFREEPQKRDEPCFVHYNLFNTTPGNSFEAIADLFDSCEFWNHIIQSAEAFRAVVLVCSKNTLIERARTRQWVEQVVTNLSMNVYDSERWVWVLEEVDLLALYQAWMAELERREIPYLLIDSSDSNYVQISEFQLSDTLSN